MLPFNALPDGSVTTPVGFSSGAASAGLKPDGATDVAVLVSEASCSTTGVFTRNQVKAAPVVYDEALLAERPGRLRGVVANAQNANACTGEDGQSAAEAMAAAAEEALGLPSRSMLVLSTGAIGEPFPVNAVADAVRRAAAAVDRRGGPAMAGAMMTTDRRAKHAAVRFDSANGPVTVGGVAKGSGMIHPDMATVLGVLTTDAQVEPAQLRHLLGTVADRTFNAITVDGSMSTNDSVVLLANGLGEVAIARDAEGWRVFEQAVEFVARELAMMIVRDGHPSRRFVELTVVGASTEAVARTIGRAIGASSPVKRALAGEKVDWGRILAAAGGAGAPIDVRRMRLEARVRSEGNGPDADWVVLADGGAIAEPEPEALRDLVTASALALRLDVARGGAEATVWTCGPDPS